MISYRLEPAADRRLNDIYDYTAERWGEKQADRYVDDLFDAIRKIVAHQIYWRPIAAQLRVNGFCAKSGAHMIYWREAADGGVLVFSILHERMQQGARLREDLR